jgi:hypothetical protein
MTRAVDASRLHRNDVRGVYAKAIQLHEQVQPAVVVQMFERHGAEVHRCG